MSDLTLTFVCCSFLCELNLDELRGKCSCLENPMDGEAW